MASAAAAASAPKAADDHDTGQAAAQPANGAPDDSAFGNLYSEQAVPEAVPAAEAEMQALLQQANDSWQQEMADSARATYGRGRGGRFGGRGEGGRGGPGGRGEIHDCYVWQQLRHQGINMLGLQDCSQAHVMMVVLRLESSPSDEATPSTCHCTHPALRGSAGMFDLAERECYRCGNKGHDARNCPTIGDPAFDKKRVRLPAGIPVEALTASGTGDLLPCC